MRITSLGSGSTGNAYVVETDGGALLVDCGLNYKTLSSRMPEYIGEEVPLQGVLLTHSHTDHTQGLRLLIKHHPDLPLFANAMTAETIACECGVDENAFVTFENGQVFEAGPFKVHPFSIPHDTSDPVGYLVKGDEVYFHGTDIGTPLDSVGIKLAQADVATLESNHDPQLLFGSGRPPSVIQRIYGSRGHLSNDQAAELVRKFATPRLKRLALAHLSGACNAPHIAERTMRETLASIRRDDIMLTILSSDEVLSF